MYVNGDSDSLPDWLSIAEIPASSPTDDPEVLIRLSIKSGEMPTNDDVDSYQFKIESSDGHNKDTALFKWYILTNEPPVNPPIADRQFKAFYSDSVAYTHEKDIGFDFEDDPGTYSIFVDDAPIENQSLITFSFAD